MKHHRNEEISRHKKWALFLFLGAMVAGSVVFFKYSQILPIPRQIFQKIYNVSQSKGLVKCSIAYNVDERHYLRLKLAIACKGNRQRLDLTRNLPRFKHEVLMEFGDPEMQEVVKNRDFRTLKAHFIGILNKLVKKPVTKVYIENYFYD